MNKPQYGHEETLDAADHSKFLLLSKKEVLFILRGIMNAVDPITMHFNEGRDHLLTSVLAVDDNGLTLDRGSDDETNQHALRADKLFCVATHEKVRVQFRLHRLQSIETEGGAAFRTDLPESVLRLQRREYYRLTTQDTHALKCQIPVPAPDGAPRTEVNVLDISGGGLSVMVPPDGIRFAPGMEFANCRIELPEVGFIVATLQVRNLFDVTLHSGGQVSRAGCQFVNLPGPMLTLVQRYIIKVERDRKAREASYG